MGGRVVAGWMHSVTTWLVSMWGSGVKHMLIGWVVPVGYWQHRTDTHTQKDTGVDNNECFYMCSSNVPVHMQRLTQLF